MKFALIWVFTMYLNPYQITHLKQYDQGCDVRFNDGILNHTIPETCDEVALEINRIMGQNK